MSDDLDAAISSDNSDIEQLLDLPIASFKPAQERLSAYYSTDKSISNPSRVLRLPGTLHLKNPSDPQLVTFEDFTDGRDLWEYASAAHAILAGLPEVSERKREAQSAATGRNVLRKHLRMLLSHLDPDVPYPEWRDVVAAIRATPIADDEDESERREIAHAFSEGKLDAELRGMPHRYTDSQAVDAVFDSMPPKIGGVAYGTLYALARAAGYDGPPAQQSAAETFAGYAVGRDATNSPKQNGSSFLLTEDDIFAWPDPQELVAGFLMQGENACIFGQPKVGKTFIALDTAYSIAASLPVFGRLPVRKSGAIVYLSGEGHAGMKRRLKAWRKARGIPQDQRLPFFYKAAVPQSSEGVEEAKRYIDAIRVQLKASPILVVIDTMARSMVGRDENSSGDVGEYLALTEALRAGLNCTCLTLAHSGKDESKGIRGSNASTAGFDAVWQVEMNEANKTVKVEAKWLKDAEELGPFYFRLRHVDVEDMGLGKGAVLESVAPEDFNGPAEASERKKARRALYEIMDKHGARGYQAARATRDLAELIVGPSPRPSAHPTATERKATQDWETAVLKQVHHLDNNARIRRGTKPPLYEGFSEMRAREGGTKLIRSWFLPEKSDVDVLIE